VSIEDAVDNFVASGAGLVMVNQINGSRSAVEPATISLLWT